MEKKLFSNLIVRLRICIAGFILVILSLFLFSFKVQTVKDDFLKQLGISQAEANDKITSSLLSGSLDHYGIRNLKNILMNDRAAVVKDLATYAKQYANSDAFKKEYAALKERNRPAPAQKIETPEEMRANLIKMAKEYVVNSENTLKNSTAQTKKIFTEMLDAAKKNLKEAEDPNNKTIRNWAQHYDEMKKMTQQSWENQVGEWEARYPSNHLLYVKVKLNDFLVATEGIDFSARLYDKNGKKYFENPGYERMDIRWKMAFRAGKDAVEAAREFASKWMSEIK